MKLKHFIVMTTYKVSCVGMTIVNFDDITDNDDERELINQCLSSLISIILKKVAIF